jgi:hypothetical protein
VDFTLDTESVAARTWSPLRLSEPLLSSQVSAAAGGDSKPLHFIHIDDYPKETILQILDRSKEVKAAIKSGDHRYPA